MLFINLTDPTLKHFSCPQRCFHSPPGRKHWIFHPISGRRKTTFITPGLHHSCYNCLWSWQLHATVCTAFYPTVTDFEEWRTDRSIMEKKIETPWHLPYLSRDSHTLGNIPQGYAAPSPTGKLRWDQCTPPALVEKHFPLQSRAELTVPLEKDFKHTKGLKNPSQHIY